MPDKKLTDTEIKQALECCANLNLDCYNCSYNNNKGCVNKLLQDTLDLINRQEFRIHQQEKIIMEIQDANLIDFKATVGNYRAENETLKAEVERLSREYFTYKIRWAKATAKLETTKAEAYKECIEKVQERIAVHLLRDKSNEYAEGFVDALDGVNGELDNLLNESVGDYK